MIDDADWAAEADRSSAAEEVIRVALVMNGGVSLAVWMGGVTHEINRLLGRAPTPPSPAWRAILAVPDGNANAKQAPRKRRIVVDTVAGTSAGGLNGALLSTAIARNADLPPLRGLWEEAAKLTLAALLPAADADTSALLDGGFFYRKILEQLSEIPDQSSNGTDGNDITLLITSTAMNGAGRTAIDAHKHQLRIDDHRRIYRFRKQSDARLPAQNDFAENTVLSLCARASASFPVAFTPVRETADMKGHDIASPGPLHDPTWLIDGGVLDNAPFEPVLDEITRTARPDPGKRWLVYVVPSAEGLGKPRTRRRPVDQPEWWRVLGSLWGLKSEVDLRNDIDALRRAQASSRAVHHRPENLLAFAPILKPEAIEALLPLYQLARARGIVQFVEEGPPGAPVKLKAVAPTAKQLGDVVKAAWFIPSTRDPLRERQWQWGTSVARRMSLWLSRYARHNGADPALVERLADLERSIGNADDATRDAFRPKGANSKSTAALIDDLSIRLSGLNGDVDALCANLIRAASEVLNLPEKDAWDWLAAIEVATNFSEIHDHPPPPEFDVLLVDTGAPQVGKYVLESGNADRSLLERLQQDPNAKLFGTRLGHFGAFGDQTYRRHDYRWGRIDAALCLASALLQRVDGVRADRLRHALVAEILEDEGTRPEHLVEATRQMVDLSNRGLAFDAARLGELELDNVVESVERALTRLLSRHLLYPWVVGIADEFGDTLKRAGGIGQFVLRARHRFLEAADGARSFFHRVWDS